MSESTHQSNVRCLSFAVVLLLAFAGGAAGQDLTVFERVLVPVSVGSVPGAYGSLWSTELWYRNHSNRPVAMFPLAVSDYVPTIGRTEFLPIGNFPAHAPGMILYVSRDGVDDVQFDLRLFNRAEPEATWGTKVPVVRESEFAEAIDLINVPTGAEFRSALRIYGLDDVPIGETVFVRIYSYEEELLAAAELPLRGTPRYAELSVTGAFPEIRRVPRVRVHVTPASGQSRIWAFVSVVSNTTQHVAVVTPD